MAVSGKSKTSAAKLHSVDPPDGPLEHFRDGAHDQPPDLEKTIFDVGDWRYEFGPVCRIIRPDDSGEGYDAEVIAQQVWPLQVYRHLDDDETGIRFAYRGPCGEIRYSTVPAGATTSKSEARREGAKQANKGVQIVTRKGATFIQALGRWRDQGDTEVITLTRSPGWHESSRIYVAGQGAVFGSGADEWFADAEHSSIERRSGRSGSAEEWANKVEELATTPALQTALGASLAGAMVKPMGIESFMLHVYGPSSIGKSKLAELACSPWGNRATHFNTWDATAKSVAALAQMADDSCLVLDDIGRFDGGAKQLGRTAYAIASGEERERLERSGDLQDSESWNVAGISTGERSLGSVVGDHLKGGQTTRMVDLRIEKGESAEGRRHAERLSSTFTEKGRSDGQFGWAGEAWVSYLTNKASADELHDSREAWREELARHESDAPEEGRILNHLALVASALEHGRRAGLLPWSDGQIAETVHWAAERVMGSRQGERTPNERAYQILKDLVATEPHRFPDPDEADQVNQPIAGFEKQVPGDTRARAIWTCKSMLDKAGVFDKSGASYRQFFKWCEEQGHCSKSRKKQISGRQRQWRVFKGL